MYNSCVFCIVCHLDFDHGNGKTSDAGAATIDDLGRKGNKREALNAVEAIKVKEQGKKTSEWKVLDEETTEGVSMKKGKFNPLHH